MNLLLFTGAGASVELGVPTMRRLAEDLHAHLKNQKLPENIFDHFNRLIKDADYDVEKLIELVDSLESGEKARQEIGLEINNNLLNAVRTMRWETEWYIQHACEQIKDLEAYALWGAALRRSNNHNICFVTTNYDRSIEIGCKYTSKKIDDGFSDYDGQEFAQWKGINVKSSRKILKIHGSTDWYLGEDDLVYKLKHPMPLYGDLSISSKNSDIPKMTSAIVLPTREKKINQPPYPDLNTDFRNAARDAEIAVFIGTSLRDPDIKDIFQKCSNRLPTYLVSVEQRQSNLLSNSQTKIISQTASEFLVSTLPKFLDNADPKFLDETSMIESNEVRSVLPWIVTAEDNQQSPDVICNSIEKLVDNNISIDFSFFESLLKYEDSTVRSYALALVPNSVDCEAMLNTAEDLATVEPNGKFARELTTLKKIMKR